MARAGLLCGRPPSPIPGVAAWKLPDLGTLSDQELRDLIRELMVEEHKVSYERRLLHGKIDILRGAPGAAAEAGGGGRQPLHEIDVDKPAAILARRRRPRRTRSSTRRSGDHVHCPECGFQNPEAANYCSKCGALLIRDEQERTRP